VKEPDDPPKLTQGLVSTRSGRYDKIGVSAFLAIRHLLFQDRGQTNRGHPGPPQHPLALYKCRCRYDEHIIASTIATGFK
jgi:hypothetical protein